MCARAHTITRMCVLIHQWRARTCALALQVTSSHHRPLPTPRRILTRRTPATDLPQHLPSAKRTHWIYEQRMQRASPSEVPSQLPYAPDQAFSRPSRSPFQNSSKQEQWAAATEHEQSHSQEAAGIQSKSGNTYASEKQRTVGAHHPTYLKP